MGELEDFGVYVNEFARLLRRDGHLVVCAPRRNHFIFSNSKPVKPGYRLVQVDPVGIRNGELLRMFRDEADINRQFETHFDRFIIGTQDDNYFGEGNHFYLVVCQKKAA